MSETIEDEVIRLRAENKSMDKIIMSLIDRLGAITSARILQGKDIAELSARNAELSVEIERLRGVLTRIGLPGKQFAYCQDGHEEAVLLARVALKENSDE